MANSLTPKQKQFVSEYLIDLNATQAAIRAGYSKKTADVQGVRMLGNVKVQEALNKAMNKREQRTEITQDRVLKELAKIAFSNGSDFAKVVTKPVMKQRINETTGEWEEKEVEEQFVELTDTDQLSEDKKAAIAGIKEGKFGIEVQSCDKVKALELIGKHLGMFKDKVELSGQVNNPYEGLTTEQLLKLIGDENG
ncbi:MAG: terminase small subunit [Alphaproteobacteria bacterium]|nr:terminase small subunit [Alphaproteobacteria bacterium]